MSKRKIHPKYKEITSNKKVNHNNSIILYHLPQDVLNFVIFGFLDNIKDILQLRLVCKALNNLISDSGTNAPALNHFQLEPPIKSVLVINEYNRFISSHKDPTLSQKEVREFILILNKGAINIFHPRIFYDMPKDHPCIEIINDLRDIEKKIDIKDFYEKYKIIPFNVILNKDGEKLLHFFINSCVQLDYDNQNHTLRPCVLSILSSQELQEKHWLSKSKPGKTPLYLLSCTPFLFEHKEIRDILAKIPIINSEIKRLTEIIDNETELLKNKFTTKTPLTAIALQIMNYDPELKARLEPLNIPILINWSLPIIDNITADDLELVKYLIQAEGYDPNIRDMVGNTPLHVAINNRLGIAEYLVRNAKADVNAKDCGGFAPLHYAANSQGKDLAICLVGEGNADVNANSNNGQTPLHIAVMNEKLKLVKYLVEKGNAEINAQDYDGSTPLHFAAQNGYLNIVQYLAKNQLIRLNAKDREGCMPLHIAAQAGRIDIVEYFVQHCSIDIDAKNNQGFTASDLAVNNGYPRIAQYLVTQSNAKNNGSTQLHLAAENGNLKKVVYCIKNGSNVNAQDKKGYTPLHLLSMIGEIKIIKYLVKDCYAKVDIKDNNDFTPLLIAAKYGHLNVVEYLDFINVKNNTEFTTPLHIAAENGHLDIVEWYRCYNDKDKKGCTPLHLAAKNGHLNIVKYLVNNKADVSATNNEGLTASELAQANQHTHIAAYLDSRLILPAKSSSGFGRMGL